MDTVAVIGIVLIIAITVFIAQQMNQNETQQEVIDRKRRTHNDNALIEDLQATLARLAIEERLGMQDRAVWIGELKRRGLSPAYPEDEQRRAETRLRWIESGLTKLAAGRPGPTAYDPDTPSGVVIEVESFAD